MSSNAAQRDYFTEQFEDLRSFYVNFQNHLNFGYGLDITANLKKGTPRTDVAVDILNAIFSSDPFLSLTDKSAIESILSDYINGNVIPDSAAEQLNAIVNHLPFFDVQEDAKLAMDAWYDQVVIPFFRNKLGTTFYNNLPSNVATALEEVRYNSSVYAIGPKLSGYLVAHNYAGVAYELAFNTANGSDIAYGKRAVLSASQVLGFAPTIDGDHFIASLTPTADMNSQTVIQFLGLMSLSPNANFSAMSAQHFYAALNPYLSNLGYYIVQTDDTVSSIATAHFISSAALARINSVFPDASFNTGGILHIPTGELGIGTDQTSLPKLKDNKSYVLDPLSETAYVVGGNLYGLTNGALILDNAFDIGTGRFTTFAQGTYGAASVSSGGDVSVTLTTPDGFVLGTYDTDPSFTLPNGTVISGMPDASGVTLVDALGAGASPEEVLTSYLSQLGASVSENDLNEINFEALNPTGSAGTITGTDTGPDDVLFSVNGSTGPGAMIAGIEDKTNTLAVTSANLTQDSISGIQILSNAGVALTQDQLDSFTTVTGNGDITLTSAGTVDLTDDKFTGAVGYVFAQNWGGTTLIGDDTNEQTLTASLFGNDTLTAGNGTDDVLVAGLGVDTITGGTGGDTFYATNGLAAGSSITGLGTGNLLIAAGDISGATISGIQTLEVDPLGPEAQHITLTADQVGGFGDITVGGIVYLKACHIPTAQSYI